MFLHAFFKGFLKNIDFRSVALVTHWNFFRPVPYPKFFSIFHGDSVKNESARTRKVQPV